MLRIDRFPSVLVPFFLCIELCLDGAQATVQLILDGYCKLTAFRLVVVVVVVV